MVLVRIGGNSRRCTFRMSSDCDPFNTDDIRWEPRKKGKSGNSNKSDKAASAAETEVGAGSNEFTADARRSIFGNEPTTSGPAAVELPEAESEVRIGDRTLSKVEVDKMDSVIAAATASAERGNTELETEIRVPKIDPLKQVSAAVTIDPHFS